MARRERNIEESLHELGWLEEQMAHAEKRGITCGCASITPKKHSRFTFKDCECTTGKGREVLFKAKVLTVKEL